MLVRIQSPRAVCGGVVQRQHRIVTDTERRVGLLAASTHLFVCAACVQVYIEKAFAIYG